MKVVLKDTEKVSHKETLRSVLKGIIDCTMTGKQDIIKIESTGMALNLNQCLTLFIQTIYSHTSNFVFKADILLFTEASFIMDMERYKVLYKSIISSLYNCVNIAELPKDALEGILDQALENVRQTLYYYNREKYTPKELLK